MAKRRSPVLDYGLYLLVRILVCLVQMLSWDWALGLAGALAWLAYHLNRRHRRIALDNLRHAFGHLSAAQRDALVRASYLHLVTMVVEMIRMPRVLHSRNVYDYVHHAHPDDLERIRRLLRQRQLLILTGHFGNWEILSYVAGLVGFRGAVVARRLDNPYLDRFISQFRRHTGHAVLDKTLDYARILGRLDQAQSLGMVADQNAGPRGLFVSFLGRPASTTKAIALLSLEYDAVIIVLGAARVGQPMRYRVYLEDVIRPEEYAGRADAPRAITQRYTDALERLVRRHPEQYFWLHRRWKHQPPQRKAKRAA